MAALQESVRKAQASRGETEETDADVHEMEPKKKTAAAKKSARKTPAAAARAKAEAAAVAKAQAIERAKAAVAERRKKEGIFSSIKNGISGKWNSFKNDVTSTDWWKHKGVDFAVGFLAIAGTAACIASVVCTGGLFIVGASALFVTGIGAHMAVASEEERSRGGAQYLARTAKAEAKGMFLGATFGRGMLGAIRGGAKQGIAGPGLTTRGASDPLLAVVPRGQWGKTLINHVKGLW
ncbi:hypothetical protein [Streptomyces sp. NPDC058291]|uniref:hypothetical protein n=1 Tax=Streptomyces sp. NPDC058291 TaxID=3346427 RepID=UPI0036E472C4